MVKINKKGFTLVEMLLVIAIIVILLTIIIQFISSSLEKTKSAACASNRNSIIKMIQSEIMLNNLDTDKIQDYANGLNIECPSGGTYKCKYNEEKGIITVECTKHTQTVTQGIIADFTQMRDKYTDYSSYKSNDKLRDAMFTQLGEKWNTIKFNDSDKEYSIQPYWNTVSDEVYVFASTQNDTKGNWYTDHIYRTENATWYSGPAFSFVGKYTCWDDVWDEMQDKGWEVTEVEYEI